MGYIPPSLSTAYRTLYLPDFNGIPWAIDASPRMIVRRDPKTYRDYVRDLYGERGTDWMPALNAALLAGLVALPILGLLRLVV
jgi:hypothetical protein